MRTPYPDRQGASPRASGCRASSPFLPFEMSRVTMGREWPVVCTTAGAAYAASATSTANRSSPAGWLLHSSAHSMAEHLPLSGTSQGLVRPHELAVSFRIRQTVCPEGGKDAPPRRKKTSPFLSLFFPSSFFDIKKCSSNRHTCTCRGSLPIVPIE